MHKKDLLLLLLTLTLGSDFEKAPYDPMSLAWGILECPAYNEYIADIMETYNTHIDFIFPNVNGDEVASRKKIFL